MTALVTPGPELPGGPEGPRAVPVPGRAPLRAVSPGGKARPLLHRRPPSVPSDQGNRNGQMDKLPNRPSSVGEPQSVRDAWDKQLQAQAEADAELKAALAEIEAG